MFSTVWYVWIACVVVVGAMHQPSIGRQVPSTSIRSTQLGLLMGSMQAESLKTTHLVGSLLVFSCARNGAAVVAAHVAHVVMPHNSTNTASTASSTLRSVSNFA